MRTFEVAQNGNTAMGGHPHSRRSQVVGFRAPGAGVLIVEEGMVWVTLPDGSRQDLSAKPVVVFETDDWVEYGGAGQLPWTVTDYRAAVEPFKETERRLNEIFNGGDPAGSH